MSVVCHQEVPVAQTESSPIVKLWILRLAVPLNGHIKFVTVDGFNRDSMARMLGLGEWIDSENREFDQKLIRMELRKLHQAAERTLHNDVRPACLASNLERISKMMGLSEADCCILEFIVLINHDPCLELAGNWLGPLTSGDMFHALSVLLDLYEAEVRASLSRSGILIKSGLVSINWDDSSFLCGKLDLLSRAFADHILSSDADPFNFLRSIVTLSSPAELNISDFEHIAQPLAVLKPYLSRALASKRKGVNVHGGPGTGKSQLTRALAKELGCQLFEVSSEDSTGDPTEGDRRLRALRVAQSFFSKGSALILFDEAEDVFNNSDHFSGQKSSAQLHKAWINRMLENNAVPCIWLSNTIGELDPAFVRRFDMVFEMQLPSKKQRLSIIDKACSDLLDAAGKERIAQSESLAPAVVTRAASVVHLIRDDLGRADASSALELLINNTLQAQGHKTIVRNDPNRLSDIYDPAFIHADADLTQIAGGLMQAKSGRLCLYGPLGTGKTAFARWLAQQLDIPLLVKRASDLMSMYVGGTEQKIARAFKEAEQDDALLLIDEVDSFLQDRRGAHRSWEVSQVNEMLTQIESFAGVFIASTNLMTGLDQAALRRFDLKVKLDYLQVEQACALMRRYCSQLSLPEPEPAQLAKLRRLRKLTPGDFAAVMRQSRFRPLASTAALVTALEAECAMKEGGPSGIGFLQ